MSLPIRIVERGSGIAIPVFAGAALGGLLIGSPFAAVCAIFGGFGVFAMGRDPLKVMGVLILLIPFLGTHRMSQNLSSIPGTKPYQLLAVLVAATAIWHHRHAHRFPARILAFTTLTVFFFTVCVLRAIPNLENLAMDGQQVPTVGKFILMQGVKPLIFFLPFVIIIAFCRSAKEIDLVICFMAAATVGLASYLLYIYIFHARGLNVREATLVYDTYLGMHRNALGSLLMVSFPFLIARLFLRHSFLNVAAVFATVAATCILFSRTAYLTLALAPIMYAVISKRVKAIPIIVGVYFVIFFLTPSIVRERAMVGLDSNSANEISAGRLNQVWLPTIEEYLAAPVKLLFGGGRFAIASTQASLRGAVLEVKSTHNMYIEQVMDGGLVGLFFMLAFMAVVFVPILRTLGRDGDLRVREYHYAVAVSAACYFLGGMTGRTMFPSDESSFFWIMVAIAVAITLLGQADEPLHAKNRMRTL